MPRPSALEALSADLLAQGLLKAIKQLIPLAIERYCAQHLVRNVIENYGGLCRTAAWAVVYAPTRATFDLALLALAKIREDAADYMDVIRHSRWAVCAAKGSSFGRVTSNSVIVANKMFLDKREMSVIDMLCGIYLATMQKHAQRGIEAGFNAGPLVSKPTAAFAKQALEVNAYNIFLSSPTEALVIHAGNQGRPSRTITIILGKRDDGEVAGAAICTCGEPQALLLPCRHVCALCGVVGQRAAVFVSPYYLVGTLRATYAVPLPAVRVVLAELARKKDLRAPAVKTVKGRRKLKRMEKGARVFKVRSCTRCKIAGHRKTSAPRPGHTENQTTLQFPCAS